MLKRAVLTAIFALACATANAQSVKQSGNVTQRHLTCWTTTGTIQDCGTAALPFASSFGTYGQGPTICANSDNPATALGWNRLCLGASTNSAAQVSLQNFGTATAQDLQFNINGSIVTLPSAGGNFVTFAGTPLVGNHSCWSTTTGQLVNCPRIPNSQLATAGAATIKGNPTGSQADVQDFTIQGLVQKDSPSANSDFVPLYDASTGLIKKATPGSIAAVATAGVSSLNGLTGGLTLGNLNVTATGASTAVTEADRAARQLSIIDFGAVCDGTANDAMAINATITAVAAAGGGFANVPASTCAIASSINLVQGVTLNGQGPIIDQLGFTQPATAVSKIKWIGGATGAMISTPAAINSNFGIQNITVDGRVSFGSVGTSALKGIKLGSSFGASIKNVVITNVGKGLSLEPGYGVATPPLISWGNFQNITINYVGTGIDFAPNTTMGMTDGGVTNNFFYNIVIFEYVNFGLNFWGLADDNRFHGAFIDSSTVASVGIIFNSLDPTNPVGVYGNSMVNFEISCNDTGSGAGIIPMQVNATNGFGNYFQGGLFNCEAPTVNAGGIITIIDDANPNFVQKSWKPLNGFTGFSLQNQNAGSSATTGIEFGSNVTNGLAHIVANSSTNGTFGGVNSLNIYNDTAFPVAFGVNGVLRGKFDNTGFTSIGALTLSNDIGNANGTNPLCYNNATGAVTYASTACTASDASLKRDFAPITGALDLIKNVDGGYFYWKDPSYGAGRQIGLIANAAEGAMPELVSKDKDGLRGFDYQHFTAVLLQAVKELKVEVDSLKRSRRATRRNFPKKG